MFSKIRSNDRLYWLALHKHFFWTFTPRELDLIKKKFGSLEKFWYAERREVYEFAEEGKIKRNKIDYFLRYKSRIDFEEISELFEEIESKNIKMITCWDKDYPSSLKSNRWPVKIDAKFIYNPRVIFVLGSNLDFSNCVSIVGTRKCSKKGEEKAYELGEKYSRKGYTVVSGLAVGIDAAAHRGAIDAKGRTIAVLPWLEPVYPKENQGLAEEIQGHGCLLSEFYRKDLVGRRVDWFLERNKIIAALSDKIIIVETGVRGGSIRVARIARKLGRKIYVCKPLVDDKDKIDGFNRLIDQYGAEVHDKVNDL